MDTGECPQSPLQGNHRQPPGSLRRAGCSCATRAAGVANRAQPEWALGWLLVWFPLFVERIATAMPLDWIAVRLCMGSL